MSQIIYEKLKSVACAKGTITYKDIAPLACLDMKISGGQERDRTKSRRGINIRIPTRSPNAYQNCNT